MTENTLSAELESLCELATEAERREQEMALEYHKHRNMVFHTVECYNAKRVEVVTHELAERGLSWCTRCEKPTAHADLELVFYRGTSQESCGYEGGDYCYRDYAGLHRACPTCRNAMATRHGWTGSRDSSSGEQEKFHAFKAEQREDGYYANFFGDWSKLTPEKGDRPYELPTELPEKLLEELAAEWEIVPQLKVREARHCHGLELVEINPPKTAKAA